MCEIIPSSLSDFIQSCKKNLKWKVLVRFYKIANSKSFKCVDLAKHNVVYFPRWLWNTNSSGLRTSNPRHSEFGMHSSHGSYRVKWYKGLNG